MKANAANQTSLNKGAAASQGKAAQPTASANQDADSDDDEEGRTALVGKKRRRGNDSNPSKQAPKQSPSEGAEDDDSGTKDMPVRQAPSKGRKKATSYLDEILAQRANKKKKK